MVKRGGGDGDGGRGGEGRGGEKGGLFLLPPHLSFSALWHPSLHPTLPHSTVHTPHQTLFTSLRIYIFIKEIHVKLYEIMLVLCEGCCERMVILMKGGGSNLGEMSEVVIIDIECKNFTL